jgi:4-hydroxybenzoate polyprenyltransferase
MLAVFFAALRTMRPKQWTKILIVFAAYLFSLSDRTIVYETELALALRALFAFALFCLLSSSVYIINDILDREADRLHPKKRNRPIASGELPIWAALILFCVIFGAGIVGSYILNPSFGTTASLYFLTFLLYSCGLKKLVILDAVIIAIGFVMRAVAGAMAVSVGISVWLVICTVFLALFLGFSKRRAELVGLGEFAGDHRDVLRHYTVAHLDFLLGICASLAIVGYTMYALSARTIQHVGPDSLITLPFVIFGIFRYLFLVVNDFGGDDPASTLLTDGPLLTSILCWVALWAWLIAARPGLLDRFLLL